MKNGLVYKAKKEGRSIKGTLTRILQRNGIKPLTDSEFAEKINDLKKQEAGDQ